MLLEVPLSASSHEDPLSNAFTNAISEIGDDQLYRRWYQESIDDECWRRGHHKRIATDAQSLDKNRRVSSRKAGISVLPGTQFEQHSLFARSFWYPHRACAPEHDAERLLAKVGARKALIARDDTVFVLDMTTAHERNFERRERSQQPLYIDLLEVIRCVVGNTKHVLSICISDSRRAVGMGTICHYKENLFSVKVPCFSFLTTSNHLSLIQCSFANPSWSSTS